MHCQYCGSINGEDDHRCLRCGRRISGAVIAAPRSYIGATALALEAATESEEDREMSPAHAESPSQPPLFPSGPSQKVIQFPAPPGSVPVQKPAAPRAPARKAASPAGQTRAAQGKPGQGNLDFRPGVPQSERILGTGVPAQLYGDGRVAPPVRRLAAGAMDVSMVLIGFGVFVGGAKVAASYLAASVVGSASRVQGTGFGAGKAGWIALAVSLILISLFYGLLWAMASRETAGMNWTQLQLVTFDGSPLDRRNRAIRFAAAWLSYCSGGLGLLWALADEESLAFHDHISKTYPAEKIGAGVLVRQGR